MTDIFDKGNAAVYDFPAIAAFVNRKPQLVYDMMFDEMVTPGELERRKAERASWAVRQPGDSTLKPGFTKNPQAESDRRAAAAALGAEFRRIAHESLRKANPNPLFSDMAGKDAKIGSTIRIRLPKPDNSGWMA